MISIWSIRPNPEGAEKNKKRKIEKIVKVPPIKGDKLSQ